MARHPVSASERRGIIVVAALALLITGSGIITSTCSLRNRHGHEPEITTLTLPSSSDSLQKNDSGKSSKTDSLKKKGKKKKGNSSRTPKTYRKRNPLDETVSRQVK